VCVVLFLTIDTVVMQDSTVPKCKICDGVMKMDVVLFGEALTNSILEGAMAVTMTADVVLVVGTSLTVRTALYVVPVICYNELKLDKVVLISIFIFLMQAVPFGGTTQAIMSSMYAYLIAVQAHITIDSFSPDNFSCDRCHQPT